MNAKSCGMLIRKLRRESGMTQLELARLLCVTDKAVSKWERGQGCPDVALLGALSDVFHVDVATLLTGALPDGRTEGGNMKRLRFAICPVCGNVVTAAGTVQISCCGRMMEAVIPAKADQSHMPRVEKMDGELCITFDHEMSKEHFLRFVCMITYDRMTLVRLYPEQDALVRMPYARMGKLVWACSCDGLMSAELKDVIHT